MRELVNPVLAWAERENGMTEVGMAPYKAASLTQWAWFDKFWGSEGGSHSKLQFMGLQESKDLVTEQYKGPIKGIH